MRLETEYSIIGIDAFKQLGSSSFYVFIASALLICIPLAAYYNFTQLYLEAAKVKNIAATQTLGQMSEMLFMLAMPLLFARWGVKKMLIAGMAAWVLRYALFAAIFIATTDLEIVGTLARDWYWLPIAPIDHIPSGNPPSAIAGGYCVIDASVAVVIIGLTRLGKLRRYFGKVPETEPSAEAD